MEGKNLKKRIKRIALTTMAILLVSTSAFFAFFWDKPVPNVVGRTENEARELLNGSGFNVAVEYDLSTDTDRGFVFYQDMSSAMIGSSVTIIVSIGLGVDVPDYTGAPESEAVAGLERSGFIVTVEYIYIGTVKISSVPVVYSQNIKGLTAIDYAHNITLSVPLPAININKPKLHINSVGGVDVALEIENKSNQVIKYVSVQIDFYNVFNDPIYSEIGGTSYAIGRITGPIMPGSTFHLSWDAAFYNNTARNVKITAIVTFLDNSTQSISGFSW